MSDFKPFANESDVLTLGSLAVENRVDRVSLHGDVELTRDKAGLVKARALKAILDAVIKTLEAEKQLPDAVQVARPKTINNPFG